MCLQVNIEDGAMMVCRGSHRMRSFAKLKAGYGQSQVQILRFSHGLKLIIILHCVNLIIIQCGGYSHGCANPFNMCLLLVVIGLLYVAYPNGCRHKLTFLLRQRSYPMTGH